MRLHNVCGVPITFFVIYMLLYFFVCMYKSDVYEVYVSIDKHAEEINKEKKKHVFSCYLNYKSKTLDYDDICTVLFKRLIIFYKQKNIILHEDKIYFNKNNPSTVRAETFPKNCIQSKTSALYRISFSISYSSTIVTKFAIARQHSTNPSYVPNIRVASINLSRASSVITLNSLYGR